MTPWLFNLLINGAISEWKAGILNAGICLSGRDGLLCRVSSLLFVEDAVLFADCENYLQRMMNQSESGLWEVKAEGKCE